MLATNKIVYHRGGHWNMSGNEFGIQGTSLWPHSSNVLKDRLSLWQENLS